MRITVLPPAFFPAKRYFDLIKHVDRVVFCTEGRYAKRRLNRTRLRDGGWLTVPVCKPSRHLAPARLEDVKMWRLDARDGWHPRMMDRIAGLYRSEYLVTNGVYRSLVELPQHGNGLCDSLLRTLVDTLRYLNVSTWLSRSQELRLPADLSTQQRAIRTAQGFGATEFVQPAWSRRLFDPVAFDRMGIRLTFFDSPDPGDVSILDHCFTWWK